MRMTREERERAQEVLPKEIPERIRREVRDCCRHDCMGLFYGSGRVRRRFIYTSRAALTTTQRKTKSKNEEKIADAEEKESGKREEEGSEVGDSFDFEHKDLVLDFCSIACSEKLSLALWRTSARYQEDDEEEQETIKLSWIVKCTSSIQQCNIHMCQQHASLSSPLIKLNNYMSTG